MKLVPAEQLVNEVKNFLHSYTMRNAVDDSILYPVIAKCISKMRLDSMPEGKAILAVENYKVELPKDFHKACIALGCFRYKRYNTNRFNETYRLDEQPLCELDVCERSCDACTDECGNMFRVIQRFNRYVDVYEEFDVFNLTDSSLQHCAEYCFNKRSVSKNTIQITDTHIETEFENGIIYLEYIKTLLGDTYMIPDQKTIIEWIKKELIFTIIQNAYYNGEPNILQRYQDSKFELGIAQLNAEMVYKRPEVQEFYGVSNHIISRYNQIKNHIWNEDIHSIRANYYGYC